MVDVIRQAVAFDLQLDRWRVHSPFGERVPAAPGTDRSTGSCPGCGGRRARIAVQCTDEQAGAADEPEDVFSSRRSPCPAERHDGAGPDLVHVLECELRAPG